MAKQQTRNSARGSSGGGSSTVFYAILAVVVIAGVAWLVLAGRDSGSAAAPASVADLTGVEADASVGLALGPENAAVTIMEFADYSCPHCAQFAAFTGRLLRQNYVETGVVRWVLYDYVLGGFPHSVAASLAARCAGEQNQYWPMHDLIMANQPRWALGDSPDRELRTYAEELGLDRGQFDACMSERRPLEQIAAARKYGDQLGVNSTPTLFLNGSLLRSDQSSYEVLERLIQAAVDSARAVDEAATEASAEASG